MKKAAVLTLRRALLDLTGVMNAPQPDAALIGAAGVSLERALFPLLVRIELYGPIGIVELAELTGRDYSTVSRQVSRLEALELVTRKADARDARVRRAALTAQGRSVTHALDGARERLLTALLEHWDARDVEALSTLLRRFADDAMAFAKSLPE